MVGPIPDDDRRIATRRLRFGFVGLVGISAAMTALYSGATILETGLVAGAGALVGGALLVAVGAWP